MATEPADPGRDTEFPASQERDAPADQPVLITPALLADGEAPDTRVNFERGMSYLPLLTIGLIIVNIIVFGWELSTGALQSQQTLIAAGALHRASVLRGEYWRLLTAVFLHGSVDHLLGNCLVLYIVGMACEHALRVPRALLVYAISGLSGSILSVCCHPGPSVGASGAIFGVVGSCVVFFYMHQNRIVLRDKRIGFVLLVWAVYQIACGFMTPFIDNFAHMGGFAGGALVTLFFEPVLLTKAKVP